MIRLRNLGGTPFKGWVRTTAPVGASDMDRGKVDGIVWVAGRDIGDDLRVVDLRGEFLPGLTYEIDLGKSEPLQKPPTEPVADPIVKTAPHLNGQPMIVHELAVDGAALTAEFRLRIGRFMFFMWARGYGGEGHVHAELLVVHCDVTSPDLWARLPRTTITWGDSICAGAGGRLNPLPGNEWFADGQGRAIPLTFWWPQLGGAANAISVGITHDINVTNDAVRVIDDSTQEQDDGHWAWRKNLDGLYDWRSPELAPVPVSGRPGGQQDQLLQAGSQELVDAVYWGNIKLHAARPCNFFELDGEPLTRYQRPGTQFWDGRPDSRLSSDMLGKNGGLDGQEPHGYLGPDSQHWLIQGLLAAYRRKASPLAHRLLLQQAANWLMTLTTEPGLSTSTVWSAREIGYMGLNAVSLSRNLEDLEFANAVGDLWQEFTERVVLPHIAARGDDLIFTFTDTPSLGPGEWTIAWQDALGAYGLMLGGREFGMPEAEEAALRVAKRVVRDAWVKTPSGWVTRPDYPVANPAGKTGDASFNDFGMPLAVTVVQRLEPSHARAQEIADWLDDVGAYKWWPGGA